MLHASNLHINRIAIVGNPNVGKSSLFNGLTRSYSLVANLPHTTMQVSRARVRVEGLDYEIIDTPGLLSLDMPAEDGLVTRSILLEEHPEILIICLDSNNLRRSLLLACQVLELEIPAVVCLNFIDESRLKGIQISRKQLESLLGVPVIETIASEGYGIRDLLKALPRAAVPDKTKISYPQAIEKALDRLSACFPPEALPADGILLLILAHAPGIDKFLKAKYGAAVVAQAQAWAAQASDSLHKNTAHMIFHERSHWAEHVLEQTARLTPNAASRAGEALGALARHPFWGWTVLLLVVYCTYVLVGRIGIDFLVPTIEQKLFAPFNHLISGLIPWAGLREFLFGNYGILTTGLENALGTVLPILALFFLMYNTLEDTGYIANLCVFSNRLFKPLGLSGKSILPIVLGFGCRTMATLTTRILESKKERVIAVFLISFAIPCAPLLGVTLAILAMLPFKAFLLVFGVLAVMEIAAGIVLNRLLKTDLMPDFILEIPPVRPPNIKNLLTKTYYRLKWFTIEAVPLFMIGAALLFVIDRMALLAAIKRLMSPVIVSWLQLPPVMVDAFLLCLLRLEAGAVVVLKLVQNGELDAIQTIVAVIVMTGFVPCFANTMAIIKELGAKTALWMVAVITATAVCIGGLINALLRL